MAEFQALRFEGPEGTVFVLADPAGRPQGPVKDSYYPPADLGHIWIREEDGMWVASGSVSAELAGDVDRIIDHLSEDLMGLDDQLATRIDVTAVRSTEIFNGEEGHITGA